MLTSCAQLESASQYLKEQAAENRLKSYNQVLDKDLIDHFYKISKNGRESGLSDELKDSDFSFEELEPSRIILKKLMYTGGNMGQISKKMYQYSYNSESDLVAKTYTKMAVKRGNVVKLYKPRLTKVINGLFKQPFQPEKKSRAWYGIDNTLIEYEQSGRPVSFLVRAHQATTFMGVSSFQYASIYFGKGNISILENKIPNSVFSDNYLRELKPD